MKRNILLFVMTLFVSVVMAQPKARDHVEVIYFHGKQRCATCNAIETQVREVVDNAFAKEKKAGKVVLRVVDISTEEGKKLAKDYRISYSSLFINGWTNGKEKRNDMTRFAFDNARKQPDAFKKGVTDKIKELLKGRANN